MVEEIFEFEFSEMLSNEGYCDCFWVNTFTMVEDIFEFEWSEMLQNERFYDCVCVNTFTMVEEIFEFEFSEMLQNIEFLIDFTEEKYFRTFLQDIGNIFVPP